MAAARLAPTAIFLAFVALAPATARAQEDERIEEFIAGQGNLDPHAMGLIEVEHDAVAIGQLVLAKGVVDVFWTDHSVAFPALS